ncbi:MAG: hypothetical protein A3J38_01485 [Gammaproteobacteria bacterium RIFCSPHIGHO2_12_FULL_45_9]|nr:MAG: hypothetical protein A3J38_01485 [Gammaproteobacteria bacterium RIFCSPHIGHO2_12_FULL_45_9]
MSDKLLNDIKGSIMQMQDHMKTAYEKLSQEIVTGSSPDGSVKIMLTATNEFKDIEISKDAVQGGFVEFKERVKAAFQDVTKRLQETTQAKTLELLQGMPVPEDIRNLQLDDEDEGSGTGRLQ